MSVHAVLAPDPSVSRELPGADSTDGTKLCPQIGGLRRPPPSAMTSDTSSGLNLMTSGDYNHRVYIYIYISMTVYLITNYRKGFGQGAGICKSESVLGFSTSLAARPFNPSEDR